MTILRADNHIDLSKLAGNRLLQKATDDKVAAAYRDGAKAGLEIAIDDFEATLRRPLTHDFARVNLSFNSASGSGGQTVAEFFDAELRRERYEFADTADLEEAKRANSWWRITWVVDDAIQHQTSASTMGLVLQRYVAATKKDVTS